ncbi:hypothetical protein [Streptomyces viridochromogenes]|uniref:hypothetical protein n=1 Tax=Streptomyces viridochromogenes TaxID=1938 RepID=UPI00069D982B|nr:hypothetical protein [Streptomyces viridochromogenes]KOG21790.1 hypothetical protein ADK36_12495 [Streptomyces viridochromogenes]
MSARDDLWDALGIDPDRISREEFEQHLDAYDRALGAGPEHPSKEPVRPASKPQLFAPTMGVQDREEFRAFLAGLGIDTHVTTDASGHPTVALDRAGLEQLRAWFAERGDDVQAAAIQRALDA